MQEGIDGQVAIPLRSTSGPMSSRAPFGGRCASVARDPREAVLCQVNSEFQSTRDGVSRHEPSENNDERDNADLDEEFIRYRDTGDKFAFLNLYEALGQRLFSVCVRYLRVRYGDDAARAMADDATQETWVRIFRHKSQWDSARGGFVSWVFGIHYHCLVDITRRSPPFENPGEPSRLPQIRITGADAERELLAREALEQLEKVLAPADLAVLMAYYLTKQPRLVAASLRISHAALRKRVERLKKSAQDDPRLGELLETLNIGSLVREGVDQESPEVRIGAIG